MDALSEPYATTFKNLWNEWLLHRYGTSEKLQAAWQIANVPFGEERIPEGRFDDDRRVDESAGRGRVLEHVIPLCVLFRGYRDGSPGADAIPSTWL